VQQFYNNNIKQLTTPLHVGRADMTNQKTKIQEPERKPLVKLFLMTEGWDSKQIAEAITKRTGKSCSRQKVSEDIKDLTEENDLWQHNLVSIGWMSKFRDMYKSALTEEAYLSKKLADHRCIGLG